MKWLERRSGLYVGIVLGTSLFACAAPQPRADGTTADGGNPGTADSGTATTDFQSAVTPLYLKARSVAGVSDVIIIDVLPSGHPLVGASHSDYNFVYISSELNVPMGTQVAWVSWGGSFRLTFDAARSAGPWPFVEAAGDITSSGGSPPYKAIRTVKSATGGGVPPAPGYYHLQVDFTPTGATHPIRDPYCPPIVIN